jgi:3-dehydroquinate synthase II
VAPPSRELVLDLTDVGNPGSAVKKAKALGISSVLTRGEFKGGGLDGLTQYSEKKGDFAWFEIRGSKDVDAAVASSSGDYKFVVVDCANWKIIPLENLIAEFRRRKRKLYAFMKDKADIQVAFSILEKGVDGIVIPVSSLGSAKEILGAVRSSTVQLVKGTIKKVAEVGDGERVCIDTASQLELGEGMLIGSKASFFFLVHSETIPTEYIPTRPFRVNAGALHSYILGLDEKTRYLSELQAGDRVQVVSTGGRAREAVVGRIKMERRPLIMITARAGGQEGTAMLQNAETIRLVRADGKPLAVTDAKEGDEVLVHVAKGKGRHFGGEVDEFILER